MRPCFLCLRGTEAQPLKARQFPLLLPPTTICSQFPPGVEPLWKSSLVLHVPLQCGNLHPLSSLLLSLRKHGNRGEHLTTSLTSPSFQQKATAPEQSSLHTRHFQDVADSLALHHSRQGAQGRSGGRQSNTMLSGKPAAPQILPIQSSISPPSTCDTATSCK